MSLTQLQKIVDETPSVSGSTFLVSTFYLLSWILMVFFFILSLGLFIESFTHYHIFLTWVSKQLHFVLSEEQRWTIATMFGFFAIIFSVIFLGVIFLCKMILHRNHFIILIEDWLFANVKVAAPKPKKTGRK